MLRLTCTIVRVLPMQYVQYLLIYYTYRSTFVSKPVLMACGGLALVVLTVTERMEGRRKREGKRRRLRKIMGFLLVWPRSYIFLSPSWLCIFLSCLKKSYMKRNRHTDRATIVGAHMVEDCQNQIQINATNNNWTANLNSEMKKMNHRVTRFE